MCTGTERRIQLPVSRGRAPGKNRIHPAEAAEQRDRAQQLPATNVLKARPSRTGAEGKGTVQEPEARRIEPELHDERMRLVRDEADIAQGRYGDLFDCAPVGYLTLGRDGSIRSVNLAGATLLGSDRSRLLDRRFGSLVAGEARSVFSHFLGKVFTGPTRELCELPLLNEGGLPRFVQMEAVADASGQMCHAAIMDIHESALAMKRLVDALFDFSRIAQVEMRREALDLSAMAKAVVLALKLAKPESRVAFRVAEGITGNGDAGLCRIVMDILIGNAWQHTADGAGTVIEFGMTELGGKPVFFVCDNGPGFDMARAGQIFVPFQRIPGADAPSLGCGMAIVKRIVKRHGGRVWAESGPGEGATFFYTLE